MDVPLSTSTAVATRDQMFSPDEQLALAGFLAGYGGLTRDAYTLDVGASRPEHRHPVFAVQAAHLGLVSVRPTDWVRRWYVLSASA